MAKTEKKTGGKIVIDANLCKGCEFCLMACPKECIELSEGFNRMGYRVAVFSGRDGCTACVLCAVFCPEMAIEVWSEKHSD